ncbi:hypothetical protein F5144DRAFT_227436 [Chaetomium tenue]|uniref:Uncharacterized protein n=1 Tax=Chaetomium tenue TaxID=1854479 RepID=A0ACB7PBU5_9PEZI|nr:hypothetical protein F5144DRAFT_227436 [Chaetomium globosum]
MSTATKYRFSHSLTHSISDAGSMSLQHQQTHSFAAEMATNLKVPPTSLTFSEEEAEPQNDSISLGSPFSADELIESILAQVARRSPGLPLRIDFCWPADQVENLDERLPCRSALSHPLIPTVSSAIWLFPKSEMCSVITAATLAYDTSRRALWCAGFPSLASWVISLLCPSFNLCPTVYTHGTVGFHVTMGLESSLGSRLEGNKWAVRYQGNEDSPGFDVIRLICSHLLPKSASPYLA